MFHRPIDVTQRHRFTLDKDLTGSSLIQSENRFGDRGPSRAHQARHTDYFAAAHGETDVFKLAHG